MTTWQNRTPEGPTMTAAEIAAWESMALDGSLRKSYGGNVDYRTELARRARRYEEKGGEK